MSDEEEEAPRRKRQREVRPQAKRWCFTWNNPTGMPTFDGAFMLYLVFQLEVGEQGTTHYQGYVRFEKRQTISGVQNKLHIGKAHCEKARGSEADNRAYCTKAISRAPMHEPHEYGVYDPTAIESPGRRTDLEAAADMLVAGASMREVALAHRSDFIRYHMGFVAFQETVQPPKPPIKENFFVLVLWGPTGTGKTYRARNQFPDAYVLPPGKARDPWGGYTDQKTIIIDEFDPANWEIPVLNQILDHYRFPLDARYRNRSADFEHVVICSNITPTTWYLDQEHSNPMMFDALRRRLTGNCRLISATEKDGGPSFDAITTAAPNPF